LPDFNRIKETSLGKMIYNIHDTYLGRSIDLYGEYGYGEVEFFNQAAQTGDIVVDLGANIGIHTLFFSKNVGPTGAVVAVEPQRLVFQNLCANLALNNITNVVAINAAAGDAPGKILVPVLDPNAQNNFGGLALGEFPSGESVDVMTVDAMNLPKVKLIKVDVNGMELQALKGCVQTISRLRPLLYVCNERQDKAEALIRFIDSLDYRMFWHITPVYNPKNFFKNSENVFQDVAIRNMLCIHKSITPSLSGFQEIVLPERAGSLSIDGLK
jgi:FkbM family methyltransferase